VIVSLLTDYGHEDDFVGVVHGVIARIAPEARVIDISHGLPHYGVQRGALVLARSLPYLPAGVHVAVVDPQVGTERRALAVRCEEQDRLLVGPDNGLLSLAWERFGGVVEAVDITRSPHRLEPVSATFHGRDLFAPVAAHLAAGAQLADAGEAVEPDTLERLELPEPRTEDGTLVAHVLSLDRFGNAALNVGHEELAGTGLTLGRAVELEVEGRQRRAAFTLTFADVEDHELLVYEDAYRSLALAVNRGDAAAQLGLEPGTEVRLRPGG
jgi:S-adenosyl-L-methionine hydrolase (adenosine-forming)